MKTFLTLAIALAVVTSQAPRTAIGSPGDFTSDARQFVEWLAKEDFAAAIARFDATMKTALPEAKLRQVWQNLRAQAGPFQKQLDAKATRLSGYDIVLVTCQFERTSLDAKVVFDANGRIAGLFFVPAHGNAAAGSFPLYARTNTFLEKDFMIGSGEWQLPGTLTIPNSGERPFPGVVLVHGSGPNDRDETVGANKPFRDLAWGLATKGVAVLRFEKRTKQYAAKYMAAGPGRLTVREESIDDALIAVNQLRTTESLDAKRIFVLGHSLGGMVAPRIGQADPQLAGLIIMAGSTRPLEDLIVEQTRYLLSLKGDDSAEGLAKLAELQESRARVKKLSAADITSTNILMGAPPAYWLDLREHDTLAIAKALKQPLLILQGGRDYQVTEVDFERWKEALKGQPGVTFKLYPNLNHLFISGEAKSQPDEYEQPGHVAETVVTEIAEWIARH